MQAPPPTPEQLAELQRQLAAGETRVVRSFGAQVPSQEPSVRSDAFKRLAGHRRQRRRGSTTKPGRRA